MNENLHWVHDGHGWPNRDASRRVTAGGLRWHVQVMGRGPVLLLVHGTGAATISWRKLAPLLAGQFTVVAPDLPGHGFSEPVTGSRMSLPALSTALGELLDALGLQPAIAAGHSAGAAIIARMSLDQRIAPAALLSINGAMLPLAGLPGIMFSPIARLLSLNGFAPRVFAWRAKDRRAVERLIRDTGSELDAEGVELYARLLRRPGHAAAALNMMAHWDLASLRDGLHRLQPHLCLVTGRGDRTLPPEEAARIHAIVRNSVVLELEGLGHLAHEEEPHRIAEIVAELARSSGAISRISLRSVPPRECAPAQPLAM